MHDATFSCSIISPNPETAQACYRELSTFGSIGSVDHLVDYPSDETLTRMLRLNPVDLLIVDCADLPRAMQVIQIVQSKSAHTEFVAVCSEDVRMLSALMRAGVRDYIPPYSPAEYYREILASSVDKLRLKPREVPAGGDIFAFLPSKPGSGASTISAHAALRVSASSSKRTLLVDLDRDAPVQAFLNCVHPEHFLQEALANSHKMDGDVWSQLVSRRGELDILPADADGALCTDNTQTRELLGFIRRAYEVACVDLPGPLDPCSVEVLMEAKRVYLVCTQELASVHIAMRKAERLRRLGLNKEIRLVLNRYTQSHLMTQDRVADLVGLPVELTIPNSYSLAAASAEQGSQVNPSTPLGKSYSAFAAILINDRIEIRRKERKFLEYLYLPFAKREGRTA